MFHKWRNEAAAFLNTLYTVWEGQSYVPKRTGPQNMPHLLSKEYIQRLLGL